MRRLAALVCGCALGLSGAAAARAPQPAASPVAAAVAAPVAAPGLPQVSQGRLERLADFPSRQITPRHVEVWLPPGYDPAARRYPVLYLHDGQMAFDPQSTWNRQAWRIDAELGQLIQQGRVVPTIVVAVWNLPEQRYAEFFPQKALALAPPAVRQEYVQVASHGESKADAYLRFLVQELKPEIDRRYATRPDRGSTFIMGSSMGGLISLYALCEYPQVFGGAAALSAHWVGRPTAWGMARVQNAALPLALLRYLDQQLPPAGQHRLWLDRGDDALDSLYAPGLQLAAELLRDRGYGAADSVVRLYPGTGHNEQSWSNRLGEVLPFLLPRP